ncbi:DUF6519 domain-containing protein [Amycolatopsis sp. NPDC005961]|uniref:DUF6519 domain-containing protein n=1 Tax=Amycolatopsis sp. NPDC005961 TaxID=3156720 RepID=UPI0033D27414
MGDFSRSTFDRVKHYVGVRLQQGVPLVDADWNELEDIRRFEVQAFLKWFVGDGVPAGNDGFRIAAAAGGGVATIRLTSTASAPTASTVSVDLAHSTAAAALGFTTANRQATRGLAPARLIGDAAEPFALTAGMTLSIAADGAAAETVTFAAGSFSAAQVAAAINASATRVTASAGAGDDFVITGGDGTPERAGRCLAEGRDAVQEGRSAYGSQPLYANSALAAAWGVPVVAPLSAPSSGTRSDLVYLDVWDREVTSAEDGSLVDPFVGVETSVRLKREWAVRVRTGATTVPASGDGDFTAGHSYLPLAQLTRQAATPAILPPALTDLRPRSLQLAPSTLAEDMLGGTAADYRQGRNRPKVNLRDTINALLTGQLPASQDIPVSPAAGLDVLTKASVVDANGGLVAVWQSARTAGTNQILAARLDPAHPELGFTTAPAITSGGAHLEPAAVALPNGDVLVAYQTGGFDQTGTDVMMKRGPLATIGSASEQPVANTANPVADQAARAAIAGDQVVFFTHQSSSTLKQWFYRRYRHTDNTFPDGAPVALSATGLTQRNLHCAAAGGVVWVAYADGTKLQALRFNPVPATSNPQDPPVIDFTFNTAATGALDVFVLALSATDALVCYDDGTAGLGIASCSNGVWTTSHIADSDAIDGFPTLVRDADGTVYLVSARVLSNSLIDLVLRRRSPISGGWANAQRLITNVQINQAPHPLLVPNLGLWLLWQSNRAAADFDIYAKQIITAI